MMKILTFGEIGVRLKAPGHRALLPEPDAGSDLRRRRANVAVSLANYGMDAGFLTVLPQNPITDACIRERAKVLALTQRRSSAARGRAFTTSRAAQTSCRAAWSTTAHGRRLRLQSPVISTGTEPSRASSVPYHGITRPSASPRWNSARSPSRKRSGNITVSCDLNYRKNLWKYGKASEVMRACKSMSMWRSPTRKMYRNRSKSRSM